MNTAGDGAKKSQHQRTGRFAGINLIDACFSSRLFDSPDCELQP
jgi:hypothetical protein